MNSDDLPYPYRHNANAAIGWLMLRDWKSAEAELKKIPSEFGSSSILLKTQIRIYIRADQCQRALSIAEKLVRIAPNDPEGVNLQALVLRRLNRIEEARALLLPILKRFPNYRSVSYNLACFLCRLGRLAEAIPFLRWTFLLDDTIVRRERAIADSDLRLLWLWRDIRTPSQIPSLWTSQICAKEQTRNTEVSVIARNNAN